MSIIEASTLPRGRNLYRKLKTNADRIRGKDDDGLADFFYNEAFLAPWCDMSCGDVEEAPCRQCILKWLKQECAE